MAYINTTEMDNIARKIEQIPDCRELEKVMAELTKMIKDKLTAMLEEMARLAGIALPPTSLPKLIKWAKNLAGQAYAQFLDAVATYTLLVAAFTRLLKAVQDKLANLDCSNIRLPNVNDIIPAIPDTGIFLQLKQAYAIADQLKAAQAAFSTNPLSAVNDLLSNNLASITGLDAAQQSAQAAAGSGALAARTSAEIGKQKI